MTLDTAKSFHEKMFSSGTSRPSPNAMYRIPRSRPNFLFHKYDFLSVQTARQNQMTEEIAAMPADAVASADVEAMVSGLAERFGLEIPELIEGAISLTAEEAQADVSGDIRYGAFGPGPHYAPGIKVTYYVPFSGDKKMFDFKPSTWGGNLPAAEVGDSELTITFVRPGQDVAATKVEFDRQLSLIKQYLGWLTDNCCTFNASLPAVVRQAITARKSRLEQMSQSVGSMGVQVRRPAAPTATRVVAPAPSPRVSAPESHVPVERYDVALSFAGENRTYVHEVAKLLKDAGVSVFYDEFERADLWGKNLIEHLADVYGKNSRFVVMFISKEYVEKAWTTHERRHAQERALVAQAEYILPARFDDTPVPGMTTAVSFQDLRHTTPAELALLIVAKIRR